MSYNEVFLSLKEFFPMVDDRILKAVAIEHYKNDVEVAADYIVSQVLPSLRRLPVPRAETCCRRHPDEGKLSCVSIEHTTAKAVQKDVGITVHAVPTLLEQKEPCTEESPDFVEFGAREEKYASSSGCDYEESRKFLIENNCEEVAVDDKFCAARITRSSQILNTELLEDFVNDAKNSKNTLIRAMESVVGLLQEVECREKEATQAKDAAGKAGLDILAKVEDLKQLLMHSKEANDMHAGEVYGEKSVLATEARELQSRLFILADERDKSLSVLEDIRKSLEARLAVAEAESMAAEEEKLTKVKVAHEALSEQEVIMDLVVQESKKLQQEAEENTKLREFLMDRGHVVDMLQGEMAVISKDVMSLKEKIDRCVSFTEFSRSGLTSLTSSSTCKSSTSDKVPKLLEVCLNQGSESQLLVGRSQDKELPVMVADETHFKAHSPSEVSYISDDEWYTVNVKQVGITNLKDGEGLM